MFTLNRQALLGSIESNRIFGNNYNKYSMTASVGSTSSTAQGGFTAGGTIIQQDFSFSMLDGFIDYKNQSTLYKVFREIYMLDAVSGPAIDQLASLPWSSYSIVGIEDKEVLETYSSCLSELNLIRLLTHMSTSYLVLGIMIGTLVFDKSRGIFSDCILYNPDDCEIQPIPMIGYDPKVNLKVSKEMTKFMSSSDPRDIEARKELGPDLQAILKGGKAVPLEPLSTIILSRTGLPGIDNLSYLSRILPIWIVEKALTRGTIIASTQRQRGILHITCLTGDTLVDVDGKLKRLDNIVPYDKNTKPGTTIDVDFTTVGIDGKRVKVNKWIYQGERPVYKVETKSGYTLTCTDNHKFVTISDIKLNYTFKQLKELSKGDYLVISNTKHNIKENSDKLVTNFKPNGIKNIKIPKKMSPKLAYLLGMLLSDGEVNKYGIRIMGCDKEQLNIICVYIEEIFNLKCKPTLKYRKGQPLFIKGIKTCVSEDYYVIKINSTSLISFLELLGIYSGEKLKNKFKNKIKLLKGATKFKPSYVRQIPTCILESNNKSRFAFIAGYIDGDGCISTTRDVDIIITSVSNIMLVQLQILLNQLGIKSSRKGIRLRISKYNIADFYKKICKYIICSNKKIDVSSIREKVLGGKHTGLPTNGLLYEINSRYVGRTNGSRKEYIFKNDNNKSNIVKYWGKISNSILTNRINKFLTYERYKDGCYNELLSKIREISNSLYNNLIKMLENNVIYDEITSIEKVGVEKVYDLSIDTSNGDAPVFAANGILVHNCGSEEWEPTEEQQQAIATMFANANRDPQGAIVVTRPDVVTSEIRDGSSFWGVSAERDSFTQIKLRALGLSETFGADTTYSAADDSMTMFLESLKNFRDTICRSVIYDKIFLLLAKYHGFRKRTKAELNHNLRYDINSNHASRDEKTYKRALMTGSRNLAEAATYNIPELKWTKELQPSGDSNALSLLQTAKEMGLPIPISYLSTYAGIPLPTLMDSLTEDLEARKKLKEYTDELNKINPPPKEEDEGMFASVKEKEDKFNSNNKHRILGNNNFNFNYNKELVSKLNHSHVIPAKEIVKIKDKDSLLNYLQQNITDDVKITKSQAKKLIQQANAVKPGLVKF